MRSSVGKETMAGVHLYRGRRRHRGSDSPPLHQGELGYLVWSMLPSSVFYSKDFHSESTKGVTTVTITITITPRYTSVRRSATLTIPYAVSVRPAGSKLLLRYRLRYLREYAEMDFLVAR